MDRACDFEGYRSILSISGLRMVFGRSGYKFNPSVDWCVWFLARIQSISGLLGFLSGRVKIQSINGLCCDFDGFWSIIHQWSVYVFWQVIFKIQSISGLARVIFSQNPVHQWTEQMIFSQSISTSGLHNNFRQCTDMQSIDGLCFTIFFLSN
jgi:hypothetical protein